jgi:hypothetical protein
VTRDKASSANRIGALALHAAGKAGTRQARSAFLAKFEAEVDPEAKLNPAERRQRARFALRLYMTRLARRPRTRKRGSDAPLGGGGR